MQKNSYSLSRKMAAWGVHLFTSSGILAGFMALLAIADGQFREAALWLALSQVIDGFDGILARWVKVEEVLPYMSGKTIDMVVDFATYAIIPAYFIYESGIMAAPLSGVAAAVILMVSAMYYGKDGMVSDDYHFVGFPVMWNLVAFYLYFVLGLSSTANFIVIAVLGVLHFVPIKFAYPSRATRLRWLSLPLGTALIAASFWIVWIHPQSNALLNAAALLLLGYFGVLAVVDTFRKGF